MRRRLGTAVVVVLAAVARAATAQAPFLVDRIVAVVGTQPILASQLDEEIASAQAQGQQMPTDSAGRAAVRRRILNNLVETELLVQQAERDTSVKVTEQEVQEAVEQTVRNVRNRFASEQEFQSQLKLAAFGGIEEWRRWLTEQQRRQILQQRLIESLRQKGKIKPIPPSDAQMRAYWEENRTDQRRPSTVSFRQIIILPQPDSGARAQALAKADSLLKALRAGADFADLARRFSDDSVSRDSGGSLGWFRRGTMVKPFEDAVFAMKPNEVVGPVESDFGYHVIKLLAVTPGHVRPFDEVKPQIEIDLKRQKTAQKFAAAADQFQHEEWNTIVVLDPVDGSNVGMVQGRECLRFPFETGNAVGVGTTCVRRASRPISQRTSTASCHS